jgi:hypothetical protein
VSHPSGPNGARQVEEQRDCTHLRSSSSSSYISTCHLRYLDYLDYPEGCGEASGGVWRRALAYVAWRGLCDPRGRASCHSATPSYRQPSRSPRQLLLRAPLQLQARSFDTSGVEGDGATFMGKKSFEATSGNRTRDPANQSFRLTTQHACISGRKHHPSCLPTALKLAQMSAASPPGGSEGGPGGRWWPYCLRGHHGRKPASGSPPVGTQSSHLGSLWKEHVPAASHLWAPRAATSVLCGKNTCHRRAVCGQPEQPSQFFVERTCVRAFK